MSAIRELTSELIRRASVTPDDAGCQELIGGRLAQAGFQVENLRFGEVDNIWVTHGTGAPVLAFLGHTDVVPSGPPSQWASEPFVPVIRDGKLYGRGAADMKGSVAAMVLALEQFVAAHPQHAGTIALLLTSDEEGAAKDGIRRVAQTFRDRGQPIHWCVVGEPSSTAQLGDVIRVGRRGSLSGYLTVHGVQGHVAYPEKADNPIHRFAPALAQLAATRWDSGNSEFPPTSFQVSNIGSGTGANNVVPGSLDAVFNFRYCTESTAEELKAAVESVLRGHELRFDLRWDLSGEPFLTREGALRSAVTAAIADVCGLQTNPSTGGGTSDGRFIAPLGAEVVEVGPVNATIHKLDEHVDLADLERLPSLYLRIAERLLAPGAIG
ncbi:succinyl-diaminopimelate desuccinylase [Tahibacter amnicola]|uniref:Succinyl-diaminopimelate desuccinylase n=1 Tax=Tahibacter amnicola TaxID=2976241 RepID=A0ABY6B9P1_9GAMM|nr:succinyl-diaminopimelate desuccinylase [Tahibacter amnicola]UXI66788.1 succinyl-diaminopimelate desuccinylase [Tahibacter amnicola]